MYVSVCTHYIKKSAKGFPGGSVVKNPPAKAGDMGLIPNPRKWQPTPVVLPGKSHGRGDWWGCKRVRHN